MTVTYAVVIEQVGANYSAYVPEIRSAIQFHLEGLAADGQPAPTSRNSVAMVSV